MRCAVKSDLHRLRTTVEVEPGEYDASPTISSVTVSAAPLTLHPDRAAIASVLLFSNFIAGSLALDRGCSPQVSGAIRRWFAPAELHVLNIDFEPDAGALGDGVAHLVAEGVNDDAAADLRPSGNDVVCRVAPEGAGSLATAGLLSVVSNGWLLAEADASLVRRALPAVAVAVLFADDLFAGGISIPGADLAAEWPLLEALHDLLNSTGLSLVQTGERTG